MFKKYSVPMTFRFTFFLTFCLVYIGSTWAYYEDFQTVPYDGTLNAQAQVIAGQLHGDGSQDYFLLDGDYSGEEAVVRFVGGGGHTWDEAAYIFGSDGTESAENGCPIGFIASYLPNQEWLYIKHATPTGAWANVALITFRNWGT